MGLILLLAHSGYSISGEDKFRSMYMQLSCSPVAALHNSFLCLAFLVYNGLSN